MKKKRLLPLFVFGLLFSVTTFGEDLDGFFAETTENDGNYDVVYIDGLETKPRFLPKTNKPAEKPVPKAEKPKVKKDAVHLAMAEDSRSKFIGTDNIDDIVEEGKEIQPAPKKADAPAARKPIYSRFMVGNYHLRQQANSHSRSLGVIPRGSKVDVFGCEGDRCEVGFNDATGFVPKDALVVDEPSAQTFTGRADNTAPAAPEERSTPRASGPLSYAKALTACASYGIRNSGKNACAKGVRLALHCAAGKTGISALRGIHCGGSAIDYAGRGCLEKRGFRNDMSQCNTPGVVRVYDGVCSKRRGGRCNSGYRRVTAGDYHGHIEFLGTDKKYHSFYSSSTPINKSKSLGKRRKLVACYVR
ncbi:MAG: hypothetical protein KDD33_04270 [Bdellovibrionales bacterium]|nr:hypothetical protein [Bdellovibrionales bacterium]